MPSDSEADTSIGARYRRRVDLAHEHAFLVSRYRSRDGWEVLAWNCRDGEIPRRFSYDGREYRYKSATTIRSAVLPGEADLVITSYTRSQWRSWAEASWKAACERDASYRTKTPTVGRFMEVAFFEHGMPRVISRHQWLEETHEWQGRLGAEA